MVTKTVSIKKLSKARGRPWRVRWVQSGKDKSARHKTKDEAEAHAAELRTQKEAKLEVWLSLSAYERNNLISAYHEAKKLNIDIHAAIRDASTNPRITSSPSISKVITDLKSTKLNNGANPAYVTNLGIVLNQFSKGRESLPINQFTLADVQKFLDSKSLNYRATIRGKLSTLFNFAVRHGYRLDNPCTRLEPIKVTKLPPSIFTTEQFSSAVEWLVEHQRAGLAWFALATLCGLRPEEAEKTRKADIHFPEGFVRVEAQTTKVRQRRVVYPKAEAVAFLKWAIRKGGKLPIGNAARMKIISGRKSKSPGLRQALGFKVWPKDITRHTAASYWLASDGSAAHVADMLGSSERILKRDYKALVTRKEAEEFWRVVKETRLTKCAASIPS